MAALILSVLNLFGLTLNSLLKDTVSELNIIRRNLRDSIDHSHELVRQNDELKQKCDKLLSKIYSLENESPVDATDEVSLIEEVKSLRKVNGYLKGQVTRLKNKIG